MATLTVGGAGLEPTAVRTLSPHPIPLGRPTPTQKAEEQWMDSRSLGADHTSHIKPALYVTNDIYRAGWLLGMIGQFKSTVLGMIFVNWNKMGFFCAGHKEDKGISH